MSWSLLVIMNGSDTHIIAAMKLLQEQYPDQNGLSNPILLSADYSWKCNGLDNFVQISNVSKQHIGCRFLTLIVFLTQLMCSIQFMVFLYTPLL